MEIVASCLLVAYYAFVGMNKRKKGQLGYEITSDDKQFWVVVGLMTNSVVSQGMWKYNFRCCVHSRWSFSNTPSHPKSAWPTSTQGHFLCALSTGTKNSRSNAPFPPHSIPILIIITMGNLHRTIEIIEILSLHPE